MNMAHYTWEDAGRKTEGEIEALAVQDLKKGIRADQFLSDPQLKHDGNFDLVIKDPEGNLKHIVVSNTDPGCKQMHKFFKTSNGKTAIEIKIGQHIYRLLSMDDGTA
ncbi:MAG: hypothetical protein Q8P84_04860 [Deltaproteobacteria bacterium]|nr:hypothetical protein [Deltaproteobacteria bacterium]